MKVSPKLNDLVRSVVDPMGYELVGCEMVSQGGSGSVFRVYIDHEDGITLDDCSAVSHQLSGVFDVEDPISGNYHLEISSPGLDRPLFEVEHFDRFVGSVVSVRLTVAQNGRKKFKGVLLGRQDSRITLLVDEQEVELSLDQLDKANLVPEF
jgi:ribosome maturation factor RimP